MDDKAFQPRTVLGYISRAKDEMLLAQAYLDQCKAKGISGCKRLPMSIWPMRKTLGSRCIGL